MLKLTIGVINFITRLLNVVITNFINFINIRILATIKTKRVWSIKVGTSGYIGEYKIIEYNLELFNLRGLDIYKILIILRRKVYVRVKN
jgi:hypothetical protein